MNADSRAALPPTCFIVRGARIRANPILGSGAILRTTQEGVTDFAGLSIEGFTDEIALIENCDLIYDTSLPKGSIVISPKPGGAA